MPSTLNMSDSHLKAYPGKWHLGDLNTPACTCVLWTAMLRIIVSYALCLSYLLRFTIKVAAMSVLRREVIKEDVRVKRRQLEVGDLDDSVVRPSGGLPPITTATNLSPTATSRHTPDPRHLQHQTPATSEGSATTALTVSSPDGCDSLQASSQLHNRINSSNTISESHNRSHTLPAVAAITNGGSSRS